MATIKLDKKNKTIKVVNRQEPIRLKHTGKPGPTGEPGLGIKPGGDTGQILVKASATDYDTQWSDPGAGSGDVIGPSSAIDNVVARYNGATGKLLQSSNVSISDLGDVTMPANRYLYTDNLTSSSGGSLNISGEIGSSSYEQGSIVMAGGINTGTGTGGNIKLNPGISTGGGSQGKVMILGSGSEYVGIDSSAITNTARTITLPDADVNLGDVNTAVQPGDITKLTYIDQDVKTTASPTFTGLVLGNHITRDGDTNTAIQGTTDQWNFVTGASTRLTINNSGTKISNGDLDLNGNQLKNGNNLLLFGNGSGTLIRPDSSGGEIQIQNFAGGVNTTFYDGGDVNIGGNVTLSGTVDGRDIATDGTKLDGIEALADVTDATNVGTALGSISIDAHSDVDVDKSKTPADGDVLTFDGTDWNAETPSATGSSPLTTKGDLYTYDTDDARLPVGTDGHVLTADSAEATGLKWAAPSGGSGQVLYDAVVASSGGDYTDLNSAITGGETSIFIRNGTYNLTASVTIPTNCTITGESKTGVVIDGGGLYELTIGGDDITLRNFTFTNWGNGIRATVTRNRTTIDNVHLEATTGHADGALYISYLYDFFIHNLSYNNDGASTGTSVIKDDGTGYGMGRFDGLFADGNYATLIDFNRDHIVQFNNYWFESTYSGTSAYAVVDWRLATPNSVHDTQFGQGYIQGAGTQRIGIKLDGCDDIVINNPTFAMSGASSKAVALLNSDNVQVNGYVVTAGTGVDIDANCNDVRIGAFNADQATTAINDAGTGTKQFSEATTIDGLTDTNITSIADNQILRYDSATGKWLNEDLPAAGAFALDDATDVTLTTPSDGQVLTYDNGTSQWVNATASAGGQTTYEIVVASSGGDYTTLGAAIAAASAGDTIYVRDATTETGAISITLADITIVGSGLANSVNMGSYNFSWSGARGRMHNLYLLSNTGTQGYYSEGFSMTNCKIRFYGVTASTPISLSGDDSYYSGNDFNDGRNGTNSNRIGVYGEQTRFTGNKVNVYVGNGYSSIFIADYNVIFSDNSIEVSGGSYNGNNKIIESNTADCLISNNQIEDIYSVAEYSIYVSGQTTNVVGNQITSPRGGITINQNYCAVTGNQMKVGNTASNGIELTNNGSRATVTGNNIYNLSGAGTGIGIKLNASTALSVITGNSITGFGTGIDIPSGATSNAVVCNSTYNCTNEVVDNGTTSSVANNVSG